MPFLPEAPTFRQTEREFQAAVVQYAELMGWRTFHDNATNAARRCSKCKEIVHLPRNQGGWPDLVLVRRPRVVFAELKSERGRLSDDQRAWLDSLRECTVEVYLWRPSDWPSVERILR